MSDKNGAEDRGHFGIDQDTVECEHSHYFASYQLVTVHVPPTSCCRLAVTIEVRDSYTVVTIW